MTSGSGSGGGDRTRGLGAPARPAQEIPGVDGPPHLGGEIGEDLATLLMNLAREVWVLRDRNAVLETLLVEKGVLAPEEIDRRQPEGALEERIESERERFVSELFRTSSLELPG